MAIIDSILIFIVGLLIGGLGLYAGGRIVTGKKDYGYAAGTAFIGALLWAVFGFFFGGIPFIGGLSRFSSGLQ
ncbi:MAG: hypothetical protein ACLFTA_03445 [Candidatus Nanohaloarchaea archaeon]